MRKKIGIIGLGDISSFHLDSIKKLKKYVDLAGVCDTEKEKVGKYRDIFFSDYRDLLSLKKLEGVIISVPNKFHYQICLNALKERKHIFCEKPLTDNYKNSLTLVKKVSKNLVFQVGYMKRFHPCFKKVKELLPSLEEIYQAHFRIFSYGSPLSRKGSFLVASGSHHLDLIRFYFGDVKLVRSKVRKNKFDCEYSVRALFNSKKGEEIELEMGFVNLSNFGSGFLPGYNQWNEEVEIIGSKGFIKVNNPAWTGFFPSMLEYWIKGKNYRKVYMDSYSQWAEEIQAFIKGIKDGKTYGATVKDGYKVDFLIHKIYEESE